MTKTHKILSGKYDMIAASNLATAMTFTIEGNDLRLQKVVKDMICVNFFTNGVVNMWWNTLPVML